MVQSFILFLYAIIIANVLDQNVYWQKDIYIKLRDLWLVLTQDYPRKSPKWHPYRSAREVAKDPL